MTQRTAQNIHTAVELQMSDNNISTKMFTSLHFTSLHFKSRHATSFPIFHFPPLLEVSSPPQKTLNFSSLIKTYDVEGKVTSASGAIWFHSMIVLFT